MLGVGRQVVSFSAVEESTKNGVIKIRDESQKLSGHGLLQFSDFRNPRLVSKPGASR